MSKEKNAYMMVSYIGNSYSCNGKGYEEIKAHHFITKVITRILNVRVASYAECHYIGNLPTCKRMGNSGLETRSLYHFMYKSMNSTL